MEINYNTGNQVGTKLETLTSFRFIGALLVFIFHVGLFKDYKTGFLGVSFFFVLSGFIMAYNYSSLFDWGINKSDLKKFYIARFSKIFPIHILTFLFAVPYYFFIPLKHEPILYVFQALTNLTLIHSFIPFGNISFNGVSWSLSDEIFFYALFPIIVHQILKFKDYFLRIGLNSLGIYALFLILFQVLPNNFGLSRWFFYFFPGMRIIEFIAGVILGLIYLKYKSNFLNMSVTKATILESVSIILLLIVVILSPMVKDNLRYGLIFTPFWSLIIFIFSYQKGVISFLLRNKILVYLGEISFSFYMVHNLILSYILFLWKPDINITLLISICLVLSLLFSSLLYHFYEEPMRKRVKRILFTKQEYYKFRIKKIS